MTFGILFTLGVVIFVLVALASNRLPADVIMVAAMLAVMLGGIITPAQALVGFSNPGMMTVAVLYIVAAGLRDTGAVHWISRNLLGRPSSYRGSLARLVLPVGGFSAFLNNTAVVAMMIPAVQDWARRLRIPASKLLLPLSYAAILGGTCTLIGTSTNLVVNGLMLGKGMPGFSIFDITWVGLPLLVIGATFIVVFGRWLLPDRQGMVQQLENAREYRVEMQLPKGSPLAGKTVQRAGLRNLAHGYLTEIERNGQLFTAVSPRMLLEAGDTLAFIGAPDCARELQCINGLVPAHGEAQKLKLDTHQRCLVEVVVGPGFPGLNKTVKDSAFRSHYKAAILSISRSGQRLRGKVGDVVLRIGDTLLLETGTRFVDHYRDRRDFLLVSSLNDSTPPDFHKAPVAIAILAGMVTLNIVGWLSVLEAAFLAAALMVVTRCVTVTRARQSISSNLSVLIVIAAAFALGSAVEQSGTAGWIVHLLFGGLGHEPWLALAGVYLLTLVFTELITNNAAAVLLFPVAIEVASRLDVSPMPYIVVVMFAASASFMTPIGYQTNMMVMGPGGYRLSDYFRFGLPMSLVAGAVTVALVPLIWPF